MLDFEIVRIDSLSGSVWIAYNLKEVEVMDIRVPTSDTLQGSDPFHKKPNWSCVYTKVLLDNIGYWENAPVWDEISIAKATKKWFKYLS